MDTWTCCAWRAVAVRHAVDVVVSRGDAAAAEANSYE